MIILSFFIFQHNRTTNPIFILAYNLSFDAECVVVFFLILEERNDCSFYFVIVGQLYTTRLSFKIGENMKIRVRDWKSKSKPLPSIFLKALSHYL